MAYNIKVSKKAKKDLKKLDPDVRKRVINRIDKLLEHPRNHLACKTIKGELKGYFRLRIGDYRVLYFID